MIHSGSYPHVRRGLTGASSASLSARAKRGPEADRHLGGTEPHGLSAQVQDQSQPHPREGLTAQSLPEGVVHMLWATPLLLCAGSGSWRSDDSPRPGGGMQAWPRLVSSLPADAAGRKHPVPGLDPAPASRLTGLTETEVQLVRELDGARSPGGAPPRLGRGIPADGDSARHCTITTCSPRPVSVARAATITGPKVALSAVPQRGSAGTWPDQRPSCCRSVAGRRRGQGRFCPTRRHLRAAAR